MDDLISRQAAINYLMTNMGWYDEEGYESDDDYKRECITELINGVPSAQPEIIQCKDCRHGVDYYHEGDCYCSNPKWGLKYFGGSWEFYCADAERRTDD